MGQQQLLLIVLAVIIVGIAIVVGISLFNSSSEQTNRDAVIHELHNLTYHAISYYKRPSNFGGGNNSFVNFSIPLNMDSTINGVYDISVPGTSNQVTISAIGNEIGNDNSSKIKYSIVITPQGILSLNQIN